MDDSSQQNKYSWIMDTANYIHWKNIYPCKVLIGQTLQWRHSEHDGIANHQTHDCLPNRLLRRRSTKISKPCVIGLCAGNSLVTGKFPAQRASNAKCLHLMTSSWLDRHHPDASSIDHMSATSAHHDMLSWLMRNSCCWCPVAIWS